MPSNFVFGMIFLKEKELEIKDKKIAFFDSGVGGLTVFARMKSMLKGEDYLYFGDLKNSPYGEKTKEELIQISKKIFDYFKTQDVKAVVMACNTTSATSYNELKNNYDFKIYPIIQSCAKKISQLEVKTLCVFATEATVKTHAYKKYINENNPNINVIEIACPKWVKIVEENRIYESEEQIKEDLQKALIHNPDKIILGCTHYPFLTKILEKYVDKSKIINPADIFVDFIISDLRKNSMLKNSPNGNEEFLVSDNAENFKQASGMFYKLKNLPQKIDLN